MNLTDLISTLQNGELETLVGLLEDDWLEAKSGKYDITADSGKTELAKDVSSFANRSGGLIVIGAQTSDSSIMAGRQIEKLSLFRVDLINPTDYYSILNDWIYPQIENLRINWLPSKSVPDQGILCLFIPPQIESLKPFLIKKDVDPSTNLRRKEIVFGYVERISHSSKPGSVQRIHSLIKAGRDNDVLERVLEKLNAIEANLPPTQEQSERKKGLEAILSTRITISSKAVGLIQQPAYYLAITPVEPTEVSSLFFSSTSEGIRRTLEHPRKLGFGGWDMNTSDHSELVGGKLLRVKSDRYKIVDLYRDGTLTLVCSAGSELLGFGNSFGEGKINPLALVEITYMFFDLYTAVISDLTSKPRSFRVRVGLARVKSDQYTFILYPGSIDEMRHRSPYDAYEAPAVEWSFTFEVEAQSFSVGKVAFTAIRELYTWFSITVDRIPYLNASKDSVDEELLKNPRG